MYCVSLLCLFLNFKFFIDKRIDSPGYDSHLIFLKAQIFYAIRIIHDDFSLSSQLLQW